MPLRTRLFTVLLAAALAMPVAMLRAPAQASPADEYSGPYFGADNFPPGCIRDMSLTNPENRCYHMRTGLNALDSPQVDVLVLVPASPLAERDMRIMRQVPEMWEGGIDYLAAEMGLDWLVEGVDFHVTVDYVDPDGAGGEFTTYPIVDPEIVVVATNPNPAVSAGIGIDPVPDDLGFCHGIANPLDMDTWESLPGFDSHHDGRTGTYVEDCGGSGGNVCFAINNGADPAPDTIEIISLFDLVAHEFGHCLTVGHVGDGLEGEWGPLPSNDIMAYSSDPPGQTKCVSTLDVEGFAIRMSRYLDVDGDGAVTDLDRLEANDQIGEGGSPFQVQHPDDHLYASGTGDPLGCPQPDLGIVPGERTDWTPDPIDTAPTPTLVIDSPADGTSTESEHVHVTGSVEHVHPVDDGGPESSATYDDPDDDGLPVGAEILGFATAVGADALTVTMELAEIPADPDLRASVVYATTVNDREFRSSVAVGGAEPTTVDQGSGQTMPAGTSTWDLDTDTVTFRLPLSYLGAADITSPYDVSTTAWVNGGAVLLRGDNAPAFGSSVTVASEASLTGLPSSGVVRHASATTLVHSDENGDNTFVPQQSTLGVTNDVAEDPSHVFTLEAPAPGSRVEIELTWPGLAQANDLDLHAAGDGLDSGTQGGNAFTTVERVSFPAVSGPLTVTVTPYLVTEVEGLTYTLTATVTPPPPVDTDGDGVPDDVDVCPQVAGDGADGCPVDTSEWVVVESGGVELGRQPVDTSVGPDLFDIEVALAVGENTLVVTWGSGPDVLATRTVSVTRVATVVDSDEDGVADGDDVCPGFDDRADADGDGIPDGCDTGTTDSDGDGVADGDDVCPGFDDAIDADSDGIPDGCDDDVTVPDDSDGDGVGDATDNCVSAPNPGQPDLDGDGRGDACDSDMDGDGHPNGKERARGTDPADPTSHP